MTNTENEHGTQADAATRDQSPQDPQGLGGGRLRADGPQVHAEGQSSASRLQHPQPVGTARLLDSVEGLVHRDERFTQEVDADASLVCTVTRKDDPAVALVLSAGLQCCRIVHTHPRDPSYVVSVILVDQDEYRDAQVALSIAGDDAAKAVEVYVERRTARMNRLRDGAPTRRP